MDKEEDIKSKIFNTIHINENTKKKYFRIEKDKIPSIQEKKCKAIFKTKKEYNILKRKTKRDEENQKPIKNNKFITTTVDDTTDSLQSDNSFLVQKIIPKKLIVKENKKDSNIMAYFSNLNDNIFRNRNNLFHNLYETENNENSNSNSNNIVIENINNKLMYVYFYSIKNLCKYINKILFNIPVDESKKVDELIYQIYQDLQILNRKIIDFRHFEKIKNNLKINKEEFSDIILLKEKLLLIKTILNKSITQNLNNIYLNIENFCKVYSS
jgi:hypothetical protein